MELGITGHLTRGDEVIKILETLGGNNRYNVTGRLNKYFYYIAEDKYKDISNSYIGPDEIKGYEIFSLEEFLENFPYKVGDKVNVWVNHEHFAGPRLELEVDEIRSMRWNCGRCEVAYRMKNATGEFYTEDIKGKVDDNSNIQSECEKCGLHYGSVQCFDKDFCPHNKPKSYAVGLMDDKVNDYEQKTDTSIDYAEIDKQCFDEVNKRYSEITHVCLTGHGYTLPDGFHLVDENGKTIDVSKIKLVKNTPYYPKTYDECCKVLGIDVSRKFTYEDMPFYENCSFYENDILKKFEALRKLIICRDAYWKIVGEELGLDNPWKPVWDESEDLYTIHTFNGEIRPSGTSHRNAILVFPIEEMRDTFHDNFKDLIEECKELL